MKRTMTGILTLGLAAMALTMGSYNTVFKKAYDVSASTTIGKANCTTCHLKVSGGALNSYGKDVQAAMKKASATKLSAEILHSIDKLDSNKNGKSNLDDIKAGSLPGN
jgi:hypothetical protein